MKTTFVGFCSALLLAATSIQAQIVWQIGQNDNTHLRTASGGGTNANFMQENGTANPLPGVPNSPATDRMADNDYYLAGVYTSTIPSVVSFYSAYTPVGVVSTNENAAERAFVPGDQDLRYHFNLPTSLQSNSLLSVTFDALDLDTGGSDPRWGIEVYFNGVLVQPQITIRPPQLNTSYTTPEFTLASVNAQTGPGFDNIVTLKGIAYNNANGGSWMGIDYVRLNNPTNVTPQAVFPWGVGQNDNTHITTGTGGGTNANFVQENGTINPLPGSPNSPAVNQQADNDYYFAGVYTTIITNNILSGTNLTYTPVGVVTTNENAAERAFAAADNELRYHFNLPNTVGAGDLVTVTVEPLNLDNTAGLADPRYGIEIYFNGRVVQPQIVVRTNQLNRPITTAPFTLGSVGARFGAGFDNIVTLKGYNYSTEGGGNWMGIDYVRLDAATNSVPPPVLPWSVGRDDNDWPAGDGGASNATFVAENGIQNPLPGEPANEESDFSADNDYYFAGVYTATIPGNGNYQPVGVVFFNEEAFERGFSDADKQQRIHFNLPATLGSNDQLSITFDARELDTGASDPRYGVEVLFNGVLVMTQTVIRPAQLGQPIQTPRFTAAQVNARVGPGFDNIITIRGTNFPNGGNFLGFDYIRLVPFPKPVFPWAVGLDDNAWPVGNGGGPNATFVQEAGTNPLPGRPDNPEVNQQADDDYYFAGEYTMVIPSVTNFYNRVYTPVGVVIANEEAAERAFAGTDNEKRYHFNLPETLTSNSLFTVRWDHNNLDTPAPATPANTNLRYGVEVYFNGILVQTQIVVFPADVSGNRDFETRPFSLASVNGRTGAGWDNIVTLRGINYNSDGGGNWMGIDYIQLNAATSVNTNPLAGNFPWGVGSDDNRHITTGSGGGTNANFVQENGTINPLPGNPNSPAVNQQADNDYYFAGIYTTIITNNGNYTPVGTVPVNENAAERAFAGADNLLRYHFNLPTNVNASTLATVTAEPLDLDNTAGLADPRYGIEIYFNGTLVQTQIVVRTNLLNRPITTAPFTLGSVNARFGPGFDNIVTLRGYNYSTEGGGQWMGIDYVRLNAATNPGPVIVGIGIPENRSVRAPLATPGGSLRGEYWKRPVWSIATDGNTNPTNRVDEQIRRFGSPNGTFSARSFVYLGNDLTPVTNWLGADGASFVGTANNLDDGAFRFTGFINVTNPGVVNIGLNTDDGSRLRIGGIDIIDNDGGHGDQTRDTNITFTAAGLYPIEITYFNGDWTSDNGPGGTPVNHSGNPDPSVHGGANFHLRLNGADITAAGASILHPPSAAGIEVPASRSVRPALTTSGGSLRGEYWKRPVWSIATDGNTNPTNRVDEQIKRFGSPSGTFSARSFVYLGNDLTPVTNWLGADGASFVGTTNNLDDGAFRFTGFINVTNPTVLNIGLNTDDGSRLRIGGVDLIDNDGGHGDQTRDTNITFTAAGLYPIEITYFNGDWTSDNGPGGIPVNHSGNPDPSVHGGANFHLRLNGADITAAGASILHPPSALGPPANIVWVSFHAGDTNPSAAAVTAGFTQAPDVGYTDLLRAYGHTVTRVVSSDIPNTNLLNAADLVIISRSVPSGHYELDPETAAWNGISTPTIILGGYIIRQNRLGYMAGSTIPDVSSASVRLSVSNAAHPVFAGVGLDGGNTMVNPYARLVTFTNNTQRGISVVTGATAPGGTVLATVGTPGDAAFGGMVVGEWPAGAVMSTVPADTLGGRRLVLLTGSREQVITAEGSGIYDLDPDGAQMFVNAVRYMARAAPGPTLQFARTGPLTPPRKGTNVTLSWPLTTDAGFILQAKASLSSATWTNVPGVISNSLTLSNQVGSGFFRLFKP